MAKQSGKQGKGWSALARGRPDQALILFQKAVRLSPSDFANWHGLATAYQALGDAAAAVDAFEKALNVAPGNVETLLALGQLARDLKAPEQAAGFFRAAAGAEPGSIPATTGLAHALRDMEQQEQAIDLIQSALHLQPEAAQLWIVMGVLMSDLEDFQNAETFMNEALRLGPDDGAAAGNLAEILFAGGDVSGAGGAYAKALSLRPNDAALRYNHALFALAQGDLKRGFADYEARLLPTYPGYVRRDLNMRRWNGRNLDRGRLLVLAEQGVGDELHFLHCLPDVAARCSEIWWECDPRLTELLSRSFPGVHFVPWQSSALAGCHRGYDWLRDAPRFDACIEAGSLQTLFRTTLDDFPPRPVLLKPASQPKPAGRQRVGISWTSTHRSRLRDRGYVPLTNWGPVFAVEGIEWVCVQYGDVAEEVRTAEAQFGVNIEQHPALDLKDDFEGTANLMAGLDMVIGPTNAARQLAASLGVQTEVLSRLPYEFGLGQETNPFYPWMRDQVRLPDLDWGRSVNAVAEAVRDLVRAQAA